MKRKSIYAIAALLSLCACSKTSGTDTPGEQVKLTLSTGAIILDATQTESSFTITCGGAWTAECAADWLSLNPASGSEAATDLKVTVNSTVNEGGLRSATVKVSCGSETKNVVVSQAEAAGKEVFAQTYVMKATLLEDSKGFNMLSDGDFEDGGVQAMLMASPWWAVYSERVEGGAASGDYYCRLNHDDIDENLGFQTVCTRPNTEYEVSAWFLSNLESGCPDTYFGMRVGTGIRPVNFEVRLGDEFTTSWKKFSISGNVGDNPVSEAFAFYFQKEGYIHSWDNVVVKRPDDNQKTFSLTNVSKKSSFFPISGGDITSAEGVTAWQGDGGKTYFAFGRNVGDSEFKTRQNALAFSTDGGANIEAVKDGDGKVIEILPPASKEGGILPTAGVWSGGRHWIHYQVIREKEYAADLWKAWGAGIAVSEDGKTWERTDVEFDKNGGFMEVAFCEYDGYVYMYGSKLGRNNPENTIVADEHYVKLARCPEGRLDEVSQWKYWNGSEYVSDEANAVPIIYTGTLGELSVIRNSTTGRFHMLYQSLKRNAVVVRDSATPEGDWSGEHIVYPLEENEVLFAPCFLPSSASGSDISYIISTAWGE